MLAGHSAEALIRCLRSLRNQVAPPSFELLVGSDGSREVTDIVHAHFPSAQVLHTRNRRPGGSRNILVEQARGDLLLFLDDDVTVQETLLASLARIADRHPDASVFGGPNETPPRSSSFQIVQGAVLGSAFGAGPVCRRYAARQPGYADERWFTLCNLAVRRATMLPFSPDLVCAEENALLSELRRRGERMRYDPALQVFHTRRPAWRSFARQMFKYGRGRGQLLGRRPSTWRVAYLAPPALLIYLILLPVPLALGLVPAVWALPAALYGTLTLASCAWIGLTLRRASAAPLAGALIVTVHLGYGAGILRGLMGRRRPPAVAPEPAPGMPRAVPEGLERPVAVTRDPGGRAATSPRA